VISTVLADTRERKIGAYTGIFLGIFTGFEPDKEKIVNKFEGSKVQRRSSVGGEKAL
jgi:hypothetical protein